MTTDTRLLAIVPVRGGVLPAGGAEAVAEAGGRVLLAGEGTKQAATDLGAVATEVRVWECGDFRPAAWSDCLAAVLADEIVLVLPASADGRDLAPRLAHVLGRPLFAPALAVSETAVSVIRGGGLRTAEYRPGGRFVATLQPGARGVLPAAGLPPEILDVSLVMDDGLPDARSTQVLDADPATVDLADARRILGVGAGVGTRPYADLAHQVATAIGASFGATRVVTDLGWAPTSRQIGTTGVVVSPDLYIAFGVSGAVQHVSGIKQPGTVISINLDASCPMMALADLAIVTDAARLLDVLASRLGLAPTRIGEVESV